MNIHQYYFVEGYCITLLVVVSSCIIHLFLNNNIVGLSLLVSIITERITSIPLELFWLMVFLSLGS